MNETKPFYIFAMALIAMIYAGLRFWGIDSSCLWFDEIFSVHAAEQPLGNILNFVALDLIHPPLFYILLKIWIGIGGDGIVWLRLFPVFWSVLALVPFLLFCKELMLPKWTRVFAVFLIAVNGSLIKYSQEVRMYSPLMCLSLFSIWLFTRYLNKDKGLIPLVLVNVLMVYTHYFGWLVIAAQLAFVVLRHRSKLRPMLVVCGVIFAAFLPWLSSMIVAARNGSDVGQNIGWMVRPGIRELWLFILNAIEPIYNQLSSADALSQFFISLPFLALIVAAIFAFVIFPSDQAVDDKRLQVLPVVFVAVPIAIAFVMSWALPHSVWGIRHLIIVLAPLYVFVAAAVCGLRSKVISGIVVALLVIIPAFGFINKVYLPPPETPWCDCEALVRSIKDGPTNIYAFEDLTAYQIWFATRRTRMKVFKTEGVFEHSEDKAYFLPRGFDEVNRVSINSIKDNRFWIIYRNGNYDLKTPADVFRSNGYSVTTIEQRNSKFGTATLALVEKESN